MSTKAEVLGKSVLNGIDGLEASAHETVHAGAAGARGLTRASSRWAAKQETAATRKAHMLKRRLDKQATQLRRGANDTIKAVTGTTRNALAAGNQYVKKNPWSAVAIASGAAILLGAFLGRRRS